MAEASGSRRFACVANKGTSFRINRNIRMKTHVPQVSSTELAQSGHKQTGGRSLSKNDGDEPNQSACKRYQPEPDENSCPEVAGIRRDV
jgi:hypothetical protein